MFNFIDRPILSIFLVVLTIFLLTLFMRACSTVLNAPVAVVEKTLDADNLIYNYEWFKQQYADIKAFDVKVKNAQDEKVLYETSLKDLSRKDWSFDQNQRWNELSQQLVGLKNQCAQMIADYNAKSDMVNRTIVKFGDLPEKIDEKEYCNANS